jgi:outer membrane protein assembly factor BamB
VNKPEGNWFMSNTVSSLFVAGFALLALAAIAAAGEPATQPVSTDWPQWRGPTRDGIAPVGPKLLDKWPKEGPPLLWKSGPIPSGNNEGGYASVVVAGGQAFVYADLRTQIAPDDAVSLRKTFDTILADWGWVEGVPDELAKQIETARLSPARGKLTPGAELDAYIKDFLATLDADAAAAKGFESHIQARLQKGREALAWPRLAAAAGLRDKPYHDFAEFNKLVCAAGFAGKDEGFQTLLYDAMENRFFKYSDTIFCLDAATGKTVWKKEFPGTYDALWGGHFPGGGTPAIAGGRCYVTGSAGFYCLSAKDGAVVWQVPTRFSHSSPLVANGAVYVAAEPNTTGRPISRHGGSLTAYDAEIGRLLWRQPKFDGGYGMSIVPWTSAGKNYLIGHDAFGLFCIDPARGDVVWQAAGVGNAEGSSSPAIVGDVVTFKGNGGDFAFKMTPEKAEQLWKTPPGVWRASSTLVYQDCVYSINSDGLRCLDLATGAVKWQTNQMNNHYSSPILADGKIICPAGGRDYNYYVLIKPSPENLKFEELGTLGKMADGKHSGACCTSPAIAAGRLYLRLRDCVACYDLTEAGK